MKKIKKVVKKSKVCEDDTCKSAPQIITLNEELYKENKSLGKLSKIDIGRLPPIILRRCGWHFGHIGRRPILACHGGCPRGSRCRIKIKISGNRIILYCACFKRVVIPRPRPKKAKK